MPLIRITKNTHFMDKYQYDEGVTYEVPERIRARFCEQIGIAVDVQTTDAADVQPNPSAELYDGNELVAAPEAAPDVPVDRGGNPLDTDEAPAPEPTEPEDAPDSVYSMLNRSGPWFDVIESATGKQQNEKPLRKSAAIDLTDKLNGEVTDASSDD